MFQSFQSNYIHASIGSNVAHKFKNILKERRIYTVTNFTVSKNKEKIPIVQNNAFMLYFDAKTTVKEIAFDDNVIPHHIFEFVKFGDLQNQHGKEVLTGSFLKIC